MDNAIAQANFRAELIVTKLILPGPSQTGALEHLCLQSVAGQPLETCIEEFMTCAAGATGYSHTTTTNKAKARIHAWLAVQQDPALRLGHAATKGLFNWSSPAFDQLRTFLQRLA